MLDIRQRLILIGLIECCKRKVENSFNNEQKEMPTFRAVYGKKKLSLKH